MNGRLLGKSIGSQFWRASLGRPAFFAALSLVAFLCGCSPGGSPSKEAGEPAGPVTNYAGRGIVRSLPPGGKTVVIQHEAFPGYMDAMTMPFEVRNASELAGLAPGDVVRFRLRVTETDGWVDQIERTGAKGGTAAAAAAEPPPAEGPLSPGDVVPDYGLTNELGQPFRLADFRGRAVAIDFIFTRCPFPSFCPLLSHHFAAVQKRLLESDGAVTNARLLSLSFDPSHDTPEILKAYGKTYHQVPPTWVLATGEMGVLVRLAGHFGLYFSADAEPARQNHNLRTVVLDPAGKLTRVFVGNEWKPEELFEELQKASTGGR